MTLEKYASKTVWAYGQVNAGLFAGDQYFEAFPFHVFPENFVKTRVRYVEAGIDFRYQRMTAVYDFMRENPPAFGRQPGTLDAIAILDQRVRGQAGA